LEEIMTKQCDIIACALVSFAALALPCVAQKSPWNGSWKVDRSTFKYDGPTFTIATDADGFTVTRNGNASPKIVCDGKPNAHPNGSATTCYKSASGYVLENTRDGKQVSKEKVEISLDGETITRSLEITPPGGSTYTVAATSSRISGGPGLWGTWKETAIKTSRDTGVLAIQIHGDRIDLKETDEDKPITCKLDGSQTTISGTQTMTVKQDGPRTLKVTYSNDGRIARENTLILSSDGKTVKETDITSAPWPSTMSVTFILGSSVPELPSVQSKSSSADHLAPYRFEVVSIKINRNGGSSDADFLPGGRFRGRNLSVRKMIQMATMVEDNQMIGVPSWTDTASYDIDGKTVSTAPVTQERKSDVMMALLEDRFSFKFHNDTKEGPVYRLEIAKGGPKLAAHGTSERLMSTNANGTIITMKAAKISMPSLTISLRRQLGRTVEDHTQLEGEYDFELVWDRDETADSKAPSLFAAIQEQLGLRLRAGRGKIPTILVDHIERPTEN
jgi:uncharacterized protein (TIGR03435 family)